MIELAGQPAGRLYVARWDDQIRIIDIALVPDFRNRGVGTGLIRELLEEGSKAGRPVTIHVEKRNPVMSLYRRLGFVPVSEGDVYVLMEWQPPAIEGPTAQ